MSLEASFDQLLHAADVDHLEQRIMELALERTSARHGGLFLWEPASDGLVLSCHVVDGVVLSRPGTVLHKRRDGRPNGIALWVLEHAKAHLCDDTAKDPHYARYFHDVRSIAAVPTLYQGRAFGVISVSSAEPGAFSERDVDALLELAQASSKFLRRAQLYRSKRKDAGRPFLIKGLSPEWLEVESQLERVASTDVSVLVHGESGTGKELVAAAIHFNSRRAERPFVAVNCAAIPETLLESALFGHVRGAFTGAVNDKLGEIQRAHGGTLFLDEVAEIPLALQAKLLRALENGEVQPVGSSKAPGRVDVRLVCATNRDLPAMVAQGGFREDLFHRVGVVTLELPPLRSYKDNLEVLALVALQEAARRHKKDVTRIAPEVMELLQSYDFPGNVRELKNLIERGVVLAAGNRIEVSDLPPKLRRMAGPASVRGRGPEKTLRALREEWLEPLERKYLSELLASSDGDVRAAAKRAGVNAVTLYRLIKRRGIRLRRVPA